MALGGRLTDRIAAITTRRAVARRLADLDTTPGLTLRDEIEEWLAAHPDRLALAAEVGAERLTFAELAGRTHRWARWAILHGIARGDRLVLLMANRPERVAAWLGLAEVGAVAALVDPTLGPEALAAAIGAAGAAHLVVDAPLLPRFEAAAPHLSAMAAVWVFGPHPMAYLRIDEALDELSAERLRPADRRPVAPADEAIRVLGPTGPASLDHRAVLRTMHAASAAARVGAGDRLFVADLALDDVAAPLAPGLTLTVGGTAVLRSEPATRPLADACAANRATLLVADAAGAETLAALPADLRVTLVTGTPATTSARSRTLSWCGEALRSAAGTSLRPDL